MVAEGVARAWRCRGHHHSDFGSHFGGFACPPAAASTGKSLLRIADTMVQRTHAAAFLMLTGHVRAFERVALPEGQGCQVVMDRGDCCLFVDGRSDGTYGGQECVPAAEGVSFDVGELGVESFCQPRCWVSGVCGDGRNQTSVSADCSHHRPSPVGPRLVLPMGLGCSSVLDRKSCCHFVDGRVDEPYAGEECVPARSNTYFDVGDNAAQTVCQPRCWASGDCGNAGDQAGRTGFCEAPPVALLPQSAMVAQEGATVPTGGRLRFYVVGSSNAAWQNWVDVLHGLLKRMGYQAAPPPVLPAGPHCHTQVTPTSYICGASPMQTASIERSHRSSRPFFSHFVLLWAANSGDGVACVVQIAPSAMGGVVRDTSVSALGSCQPSWPRPHHVAIAAVVADVASSSRCDIEACATGHLPPPAPTPAPASS